MDVLEKPTLINSKHGVKESFEHVFRNYYHTMKNYAFFYTKDIDSAEDVVQDVFLNLWYMKEELVLDNSIKSYLFRSVHNKCIDTIRKNNFIQGFLMNQRQYKDRIYETGYNDLLVNDIQDIVEKTIKKLPNKTRNIFNISRKKHLYNSEIAKQFNITEKAVEYHITKALKMLRASLQTYLVA